MSGSTRSKKAAADAKHLTNEEMYSLLNSLRSEVLSLQSARTSDAAGMKYLHMALSSPPPALSPYHQQPHVVSSAYDRCMQEPYRAADRSNHLLSDGSNFAEWVVVINRVLCIVLNSELSIDDSPLLLENRSPQENRAISHFINATIPPDFALCVGIVPSRAMAKEFFDTIKARCCPGNRFQKLKVVRELVDMLVENGVDQPKSNTAIILSLRRAFAMFKKLGIEVDELEGLMAQSSCHPPPTLDRVAFNQLILAAMRSRAQHLWARTMAYNSHIRRPPDHLIDRFGGSCFHCGRTGKWRADCPHTKGVANPNPFPASPGVYCPPRPGTPDCRAQTTPNSPYQRERVLQVQFVEHRASDWVLIDTGASIHLSGSLPFATNTATLRVPIRRGYVIIRDVVFSEKILGTILSVGQLCREGVLPFFNSASLSLLVTTTFLNDCWWLDVVSSDETNRSAAVSSSNLLEMNPISLPTSVSLSSRGWHERLGHVCNKTVISFLKQHDPSFDHKHWQTFYCPTCTKSKSTHRIVWACTDIPKDKALDLLVSDILGPFKEDAQGFKYLITLRDHVTTYSIAYPLKMRSDSPAAILDAVKQLQVHTGTTPKAREFMSATFTHSMAKLGITLCPLLPYSPQENGEAERLNRTLGDMARSMMLQSEMPKRFWQFAYARACFIHNRIPNSRFPNSSPYQELFGQQSSITPLYPFGAEAIVHLPSVQQPHKLAPRAVECRLLKPLMTGGWLLWDKESNRVIQSVSVIFPQFQPPASGTAPSKGSLRHVINTMTLGDVPTEKIFEVENKAIDSLFLAKDVAIPEHLGRALSSPHRAYWREACMAELDQMVARNVWETVEKRPGMNTIGHRWVFDVKRNLDGSVQKFKARLVAHGDKQRPGVDCAETYALTASLMSLRLLLATAVLKKWPVASFDVSGAYLYSPVEERVFVKPPVFFLPELHGKVLCLKKALYGMRQEGRCWWKFLLGRVTRLNFVATKVDQSLYIFHSGMAVVAIWIHIDNGVITSNSPDTVAAFKEALCSELDIKWSDEVRQIVGLECVFSEAEVAITQQCLADGILEAYTRLLIQRDSPLPMLPVSGFPQDTETMDATPFRSIIGLLAYLVSGSCPDLAFAVNYLARHSMGPTATHWEMLDHVVGYLLKTRDRGLRLRPGGISLSLWSDAGWGGDLERSQTGFILKLSDAPILWASKRQSVVELSTCAAEYIALSDSTQHLVQAINQLTQLVHDFDKTIFCDNQAAVQVSVDNKSRKCMRYLDRAFFFVNNTIHKHDIAVKLVKTGEMQAVALTKRLSGTTLLKAASFLGLKG
ncbi:hypothetical protein O181_063846 [Austropuccinia psidii MF-1]|uniref:Integrase catalytic domain-containing protein n=1 Tax=Austropuccinia psidii MF-1 TaxID=1389203 RepID=A0A9Q3EKS1_9BASI|nr:hypothetical protein [Austropuccinia psidii MF-1]